MSCEICDQPIYAETENWTSPLCHSHFVEHNTSTKTYLIIKLEAAKAEIVDKEETINDLDKETQDLQIELKETKGLLDTATNVIQFLKDEFPSVKIIMDAAAKNIKEGK